MFIFKLLIFSSIILNMIIGVITVPFDISFSYISYDHIKMLEHFKLKIYPIPYNTTEYKRHFNNINALYIPSGIVTKGKRKDMSKFIECCSQFIKLAIHSNNNNHIFPIWGTCLGMETIIQSLDNDIKLARINAYDNYLIPFKPTKEGILHSEIIKNMTENNLNEWMSSNIELHNHGLGITPSTFIKSKILSSMFYIVSIGIDKNNKTFISLIEGKKYPFYGIQWHPEVYKKTWSIFEIFINKIKNNFLEKRLIKSDNIKDKSHFLKGEIKDCKDYSDGLYKKCIFYSNSPI